MSLVLLVLLPLAGGIAAWPLAGARPAAARWLCVAALAAALAISLGLWGGAPSGLGEVGGDDVWLARASWSWIPAWGARITLAADGLSLVLVHLALLLGILALAAGWRERPERPGLFLLALMAVLAGVVGVFLALDLLLFYLVWELMLIPMALLIVLWGHERRIFAALEFFLFTQAGGLALLLAILGLGAHHRGVTGEWSFAYADLLATPVTGPAGLLLATGFLLAFLVKLPAVPLHPWLADAHTEAPTAGSVVLAGLLLKTGVYGLLRFGLPLFPDAAARLAPLAMGLGAAGVLYGALLAFGQSDLKRLVAYTSVSHMGFALLGVFAWNAEALAGVVAQMVCHGLSTGGLFLLVGFLHERAGTRDLDLLGGLQARAPRLAACGLVLALASLGLPGSGNFVGELLVLLGAWRVDPVVAAAATAGLVLSAAYALRLVARTFHGPVVEWAEGGEMADLGVREVAVLGSLIVLLLWLGLWPQPMFDAVASSLEAVGHLGPTAAGAAHGLAGVGP